LSKYPAVLAALIRYGHAIHGVDQERTDEAMAAVEACTMEFVEILNDSRTDETHGVGGRALLRLLDTDSAYEVEWNDVDLEDYWRCAADGP
jgi:hypothetical protein